LNQCQCSPGWTGVGCAQCTSDDVCLKRWNQENASSLHPPGTNATKYCDQGWIPHYERYYSCGVIDELMIEIIGNVTVRVSQI
jgi:hypothetical protein